jgi:hypothetical protein
LPGKVIRIVNMQEFILFDINQQEWSVLEDYALQNFPLREGQSILVIGTKIDDNVFEAENIRLIKPQLRIRLRYEFP